MSDEIVESAEEKARREREIRKRIERLWLERERLAGHVREGEREQR